MDIAIPVIILYIPFLPVLPVLKSRVLRALWMSKHSISSNLECSKST